MSQFPASRPKTLPPSDKKSSGPGLTIINVESYPECDNPVNSKLSPEPVFSPRVKQGRKDKTLISQSIEKDSETKTKKNNFNDFLTKMEQFQKAKNEKLVNMQVSKKVQEEEKLSNLPKVKMSEMSKKILEEKKRREGNFPVSPASCKEKVLKNSSNSTKDLKTKPLIDAQVLEAQVKPQGFKEDFREKAKEVKAEGKKEVQREVHVMSNSDKVLASKLVKEINSVVDEVGGGKFTLSQLQSKIVLVKMGFLNGSPGEEKLVAKMWNVTGADLHGELSLENLRTFLLGVMNFYLQSMGHSLPEGQFGRIIDGKLYVNQQEVEKIHRFFMPLYENRTSEMKKMLSAVSSEKNIKASKDLKPELQAQDKPERLTRADTVGKFESASRPKTQGSAFLQRPAEVAKPDPAHSSAQAPKASPPTQQVKSIQPSQSTSALQSKPDRQAGKLQIPEPARPSTQSKPSNLSIPLNLTNLTNLTNPSNPSNPTSLTSIKPPDLSSPSKLEQDESPAIVVRVKEAHISKSNPKQPAPGKATEKSSKPESKMAKVQSVKSLTKETRENCMTPKSRRSENLNTSFRSARSKSRSKAQNSARSSISESEWTEINNDKISDPSILLKAQDLLGAFCNKPKNVVSQNSLNANNKEIKGLNEVKAGFDEDRKSLPRKGEEQASGSKLLFKKESGFKGHLNKGIDQDLRRVQDMMKSKSRSPDKGAEEFVVEVSMPDGTQKTLKIPVNSNHKVIVEKFARENHLTGEMANILLGSISNL